MMRHLADYLYALTVNNSVAVSTFRNMLKKSPQTFRLRASELVLVCFPTASPGSACYEQVAILQMGQASILISHR
jgi:hypothetical protein